MESLLVADFAEPFDLVAAWDDELSLGGLLVRGSQVAGATAGAACTVEIRVGGRTLAQLEGAIAAVARIGVAATFDLIPEAFEAAVERARNGEPVFDPDPATEAAIAPGPAEPAPEPVPATGAPLPIGDRLAAMSVGQKISFAMSGDREGRLALLKDHNKVLHAYVLRNPRIGLDEVLFAAKLTTISPDALKAISENKEWMGNPQVLTALVRNVKTPMPIAQKFLPRLAQNELRAIAKGGARDQLVQAARKLFADGK